MEALYRSMEGQRLIDEVIEKIKESARLVLFEPKLAPGEIEILKSKLKLDVVHITFIRFKEPLYLNTIIFPGPAPLIMFPASDMMLRTVEIMGIPNVFSSFSIRRDDREGAGS